MEGTAQFNYRPNANAPDELAFRQNDVLKIVSFTEDRNWFKAELNSQIGFVPKNYVKMRENFWYMGNMTRADSERFLLRDEPALEDGSFLVRDSESTPNAFAVSVRFQNAVQHYKILRNSEGMYLLWVVQFQSINELIEYHRANSVSRTETLLLKDCVMESNLKRVVSIHDFAPQEPGEIGFQREDEILILDDSDPHWWRGRTVRDDNYNIGIFPSNYVQPTV